MSRLVSAIAITSILLGVALLVMYNVLPTLIDINDMPPVRALLQMTLCEAGESFMVERPTPTGSTSYCVDVEGTRRNVSERATMFGVVSLIVFEVLGAGLILLASLVAAPGLISQQEAKMFADLLASEPGDVLGERTRQLQAAYDQGRITKDEYDDRRRDIIRQELDARMFVDLQTSSDWKHLRERARQVQNDYDQGRMTQEEYEGKRREIVAQMYD